LRPATASPPLSELDRVLSAEPVHHALPARAFKTVGALNGSELVVRPGDDDRRIEAVLLAEDAG